MIDVSKKLWWQGSSVLFLLLLFVYLPVCFMNYGFYDEYFMIERAKEPGGFLFQDITKQGRPLTGFVLQLVFAKIEYVHQFGLLRLLSILGFGGVFVYIANYLAAKGVGNLNAFIIAFLMATLPAFQVYISWSLCFVFSPALLLGIMGGQLVDRSIRNGLGKQSAGALIGATVMVSLACLVYQPISTVMWMVFLVNLLKRNDFSERKILLEFLTYAVVYGLALIVGFIFLKVGIGIFGVHTAPRSQLVSDVIGKLQWFVTSALKDVLSLHSLPSRVMLSSIVAVLFASVPLLKWRKSMGKAAIGVLLVLAMLPMVYAPNLLTSENWSSYRTQSIISSIVVVVLGFGILGLNNKNRSSLILRNAGTVVLAIWAISAGLLAQKNVLKYFGEPQALEYRILKQELRCQNLTEGGRIYVRGAHWKEALTQRAYYDEFGFPSTHSEWVPVSMTRAALREIGHVPENYDIILLGHEEDGVELPADLPDSSIVIDLSSLKHYK